MDSRGLFAEPDDKVDSGDLCPGRGRGQAAELDLRHRHIDQGAARGIVEVIVSVHVRV